MSDKPQEPDQPPRPKANGPPGKSREGIIPRLETKLFAEAITGLQVPDLSRRISVALSEQSKAFLKAADAATTIQIPNLSRDLALQAGEQVKALQRATRAVSENLLRQMPRPVLSQAVQRMMEPISRHSSQIARLWIEQLAISDKWARSFDLLNEGVRRQLEGLVNQQAAWARRFSEQFNQIGKRLVEGLRFLEKKYAQVLGWLLDMGWPPLLHVSFPFLAKLRKSCEGLSRTKAQKIVDREISRYHNGDLLRREVLAKWKKRSCLRNRIRILKTAIEAHIRGEYELSVPALLPQIEGVLAENFGHRGYMRGKDYERYLKRALQQRGLANAEDVLLKFILNFVLGEFRYGHPIIFDLNRHAILHGAYTDYAKRSTSLKVILVLDFLTCKFEFGAVASSRKFHRLDCTMLRRSTGKRVLYSDEFQGIADGKTPCKRCLKERSNQLMGSGDKK